MTVCPANSDKPGHPPSLIRAFADRMKKAWVLATHQAHSEETDQAYTQADLSLYWAHSHFIFFFIRRLI